MRFKTEREYLDALTNEAAETVEFLSEHAKQTRERSVCAALLRCLGVDFSVNEITSETCEPPDVIFRGARFEVMEVLDEGRKRHKEWRDEADRRRHAQSLGDLERPFPTPVPLNLASVTAIVGRHLARKASRYSSKEIPRLDALVYVDLVAGFLSADPGAADVAVLLEQGWRSVSVLIPPYGVVLHAGPGTPSELASHAGQIRREWQSNDGLFDL